jgi:hypothetical protein
LFLNRKSNRRQSEQNGCANDEFPH